MCSVRIPFHVKVGVTKNGFLVRNNVVSFSVVLRAGGKLAKLKRF